MNAARLAICTRKLDQNERQTEACLSQLVRKANRLQKLRNRRAALLRLLRDIKEDKPKQPRVPKTRAFEFGT